MAGSSSSSGLRLRSDDVAHYGRTGRDSDEGGRGVIVMVMMAEVMRHFWVRWGFGVWRPGLQGENVWLLVRAAPLGCDGLPVTRVVFGSSGGGREVGMLYYIGKGCRSVITDEGPPFFCFRACNWGIAVLSRWEIFLRAATLARYQLRQILLLAMVHCAIIFWGLFICWQTVVRRY